MLRCKTEMLLLGQGAHQAGNREDPDSPFKFERWKFESCICTPENTFVLKSLVLKSHPLHSSDKGQMPIWGVQCAGLIFTALR